jgi:hypothetical protein
MAYRVAVFLALVGLIMQPVAFVIGVVSVVMVFAVASEAQADITASAALAIAERLCVLPQGAESVQWWVTPADDPEPPIPSPAAPIGRYWLVEVNYLIGSGKAHSFMRIGIPKNGAAPERCHSFPTFVYPNMGSPSRKN